MVELEELIDSTHFGNTVWDWSVAAAVIVTVFIGLLLLRRFIRAKHRHLEATPQTELMEVPLKIAGSTTIVFLLVTAVFAGLQTVALPPKAARLLLTVFTISSFWQTGLWATTAVLASIDRRRRASLAHDRATAGSLGIISFLARATIWSFVLLLTLDNLGIEIKPLLAGLGIGGIAVALALQNVLGDLFASLSITLDRPFVVGDALGVDDFNGTVEYIGVKSTRLRSVNGEQIIIPNSNLLSSRVRNHSRMSERRVVITLSVDHATSRASLEKIPRQIRELIEVHRDVRFDRAHFSRIGPTSYDFEVVYFVLKPDYGLHMDILQDVNLKLIDALEKDGVSLAQPVQRLYLEARRTESQLVEAAEARSQA
jgi:small-conductance mechanosensitive channel